MASTRLLAALFSALVIAVGIAACGGSDETTTVTTTAASSHATESQGGAGTETGTGEAAAEPVAEPDAKAQQDIDKITSGLDQEQQQADASSSDAVVPGDNAVQSLSYAQAQKGLSHARYCASDVIAGPNTSCSFALNVAYDYYNSGFARRFVSYSPVTGRYYQVRCRGRHPTICHAGNGAIIAIA